MKEKKNKRERGRKSERTTCYCCLVCGISFSFLSSLSLPVCFLHLTLNNVGIYARTTRSIYLWICPSIYQFSVHTMCSLEFSDNRTKKKKQRKTAQCKMRTWDIPEGWGGVDNWSPFILLNRNYKMNNSCVWNYLRHFKGYSRTYENELDKVYANTKLSKSS